MSRFFALRLLESFFRRWILCLLPLVLLCALGVLSVMGKSKEYRSEGVLYVESETLLSKLTAVGTGGTNSFSTPAQTTSERVSSLLQTDDFIDSVIERGGLKDSVTNGLLTRENARASISVSPGGANTLRITSTNADPAVAFKLASATIDGFIDWIITASLRDSDAAETFLQDLASQYKTSADQARAALSAYLKAHPDPSVGSRSTEDTLEISRLSDAVTAEQAKYTATVAKAEDARLASAQTRSDVAGRLRLVDTPTFPVAPTSSRRKQIMQIAMFVILGLMLSGAAVVAGALADRSIRQPGELPERLGIPMLAMLPDGGRPVMRGMHMASLVGASSTRALTESSREFEDRHVEP